MNEIREKKRTILMIAQLVPILCWLNSVAASDSYFYVYALVALVGALSLRENSHRTEPVPRPWNILTGILAAVFSAAVVLSNYFLFMPLSKLVLLDLILTLLGGWILGFHILTFFGTALPLTEGVSPEKRRKPGRFFLLCFLSIAAINLAYLFSAAFPGILSVDSMAQMNQIHAGVFDNWHPYWHSRIIQLFVALGKSLFGTYQAGVAVFTVFQVCFVSACISYGLVTLYQRRLPGWCLVLAWAAYALIPYHISYSVTMWKDVFFGCACLVVITALFRLLSGTGRRKCADAVIFFLASLAFCIWRSNGLPAYALFLVVALLFFRKQKKLLTVMTAALVCGYLMTGPVLSTLGVGGGNLLEALCVPVQQVNKVVHDGKELTDEDWALIEVAGDRELIAQEYHAGDADFIKNIIRESGADKAIEEDPISYLKLWIRLGLRYPVTYIQAWSDQTKGYWNGGYPYWVRSAGVCENELGIYAAGITNPLGTLFETWFKYFEFLPFLYPFISIGLNVWILALCCYISLRNRRQEWILTLPVLAILASLVISTPIFTEFRYIYSLFLSLPLILSVTCIQPENAE